MANSKALGESRMFRTKSVFVPATVAALLFSSSSVLACFNVVNVEPDDVLNMRASYSFQSDIVGTIPPDHQPGSVFAIGVCMPRDRPEPQRWCAVAYESPSGRINGWVKRRFIEDTQCPSSPEEMDRQQLREELNDLLMDMW
ncbi:hypothetical protein ABWH89_13305 [Hoeflea alexandrii]|uniref:hypothetical protein n=1 Tax=Hoeflea alexandrii TaxID=288436 RepID=UPI0035D10DDC